MGNFAFFSGGQTYDALFAPATHSTLLVRRCGQQNTYRRAVFAYNVHTKQFVSSPGANLKVALPYSGRASLSALTNGTHVRSDTQCLFYLSQRRTLSLFFLPLF